MPITRVMQVPTGPATSVRPNPANITPGETTYKRLLTWPIVARFAVFVGIAAAPTGILVVALQNVVALGRCTEVAFTEW